MKILRTKLFLTLAFALAANGIFAQSSSKAPGPEEYSAFSRFITERNIFDANREPHYTSTRPHTTYHPRPTHSSTAPTFTLVGTISYSKGMFAFFNGTSSEFKMALPISGTIEGYKIANISQGHVQLETTNNQTLDLNVGDSLRQENGQWQYVGKIELPVESRSEQTTRSSSSRTMENSTATKSSASLESNDVLKRLMEQKEKENQ